MLKGKAIKLSIAVNNEGGSKPLDKVDFLLIKAK